MGVLYFKWIKSSVIDVCQLFKIAINQMMCSELTCMTVSHPACFSVPEAMWAEVENEVVVVRKQSEPQVNQITELVHCFDVCVFSTEMRTEANVNRDVSSTHDSDSWSSQRLRTFHWKCERTEKVCTDSPLGLTVAVVAEGALQDAVQCHQAHVFKQFKGLIGVCITFPFVLVREQMWHLCRRWKKLQHSSLLQSYLHHYGLYLLIMNCDLHD